MPKHYSIECRELTAEEIDLIAKGCSSMSQSSSDRVPRVEDIWRLDGRLIRLVRRAGPDLWHYQRQELDDYTGGMIATATLLERGEFVEGR